MPTTLNIDALAEGDEPNTVIVKYTNPVVDSAAWKTATFTVTTYAVAEGRSVKTTHLDLPGVYRMSEASNKAIAKLYRSNDRFRISFVSSDIGIIFQPGDMVTVSDASRGVDIDLWVESTVMVDYGRYRITGFIYSDSHFPDICYTEEDKVGSWLDEVVIISDIDDGGISYSCNAYYAFINVIADPVLWYPYTQGGPTPSLGNNDEIIEVVRGSNLLVSAPYSENIPETEVDFAHCEGSYFWGDAYDGFGPGSAHLYTGDTGARVSSTGFWYSVIQVGWGGANSSGMAFEIADGTYTYTFQVYCNGSALWFGAPMTGNPTQITSANSITGTAPVNGSGQVNHIVIHYKNPSPGATPGSAGEIDVYAGGKLVYTKGSGLVTSIRSSTWRVEDVSASVALQGARAHVMIGDGAPDVGGMWNAFKRNFRTVGSPLPYYQP